MTITSMDLPRNGTRRVIAKVRRPLRQNGNFALRIVLTNGESPPTHATGLMTLGMPPLPDGNSRPMFGYGLSLFDSAGGNLRQSDRGRWLVVSDEFEFSFDLSEPGQLTAQLDWQYGERPRSYAHSIQLAHDDLRRLTIACWNGDFELYDIRFAAA